MEGMSDIAIGRGDWVNYWRDGQRPLEAMHAHLREHVYHRHSHEAYSFGVTEEGAQTFSCRGGAHTSATGLVMTFNPDDPHDGRTADGFGFTYRMVHIGPELVGEVLADAAGHGSGPLPLFTDPVVDDVRAVRAIRRLHHSLTGGADALVRDERLTEAVLAMVGHGTGQRISVGSAGGALARARALLAEAGPRAVPPEELAAAAGCSRFALYRGFRAAYGLAPSEYQRQLRLREARRLILRGEDLAEVAAATGFTDQSHLNRWFLRCYGLTPGAFRAGGRAPGVQSSSA